MKRATGAAPVRLQPLARRKIESLGPEGAAWLAALPELLAELAERWELSIGRSLPGGSTGYVVATTRSDETPAVLKLTCSAFPSDELTVLRLADGQGYARLLAADPERGAVLLERLGPQLGASSRPPAEQLEILAATLATAWSALPVSSVAPHLTPRPDKATSLAEDVQRWWVELGRPCSAQVMRQALSYATDLADPDPDNLVVVHGDPHPHNALQAPAGSGLRPGAESGYCFVDPDGFVADLAYDLGVVVRDWCARLTAETARDEIEGYCRVLAALTGVTADRIWAWGFLERVSCGLYVASFGARAVAEPFLRTADWMVGRG